jgi:hypothetical protein
MRSAVFFGGGSLLALEAGYCSGPLKNIEFDAYYGVSAGSICAASEAYLDTTKLLEILAEIKDTSDIFVTKDFPALAGDLAFRAGAGIVMGYKPLRALFAKYFPAGSKPTKPVTIGRVQNNTMKLQHVTAMPDGSFHTDNDSLGTVTTLSEFLDALTCSCLTYPIVDMWVDSDNKYWQDGGFREGGPVVKAILDGSTELHICLTGLFSTNCSFDNTTGGDPVNCLTRTLLGMANQNVVGSVNDAIEDGIATIFVYQAQGQGSSTVFDQSDIQANIKIGATALPISGKDLKIVD